MAAPAFMPVCRLRVAGQAVAAALGALLSRPSALEPEIHDRQVDRIVGVPLVVVPFAILIGLSFRTPIERYTQMHMEESNRKNGVLIEAIDGIESIKASNGEWKLLDRWRHLVATIAQSEIKMRMLSTLSAGILALGLALTRVPGERRDAIVTVCRAVSDALLVLVITLTGPFGVAFLPLFAWRWWRETDSPACWRWPRFMWG